MKLTVPERYAFAIHWKNSRERLLGPLGRFMENVAQRYTKGDGLLISGPNGIGKTWAAVATMASVSRAVKRNPNGVVFVNSCELFENIYPMGKPSPFIDGWDDTLDHVLESCRMLIIDDFGHEIQTVVTRTKMNRLLRTRVDNMRFTAITTNLFLSDDEEESILKVCGPSVASVLDQLCPFQIDITRGCDARSEEVERFEV